MLTHTKTFTKLYTDYHGRNTNLGINAKDICQRPDQHLFKG
jgi:hypothetical protein